MAGTTTCTNSLRPASSSPVAGVSSEEPYRAAGLPDSLLPALGAGPPGDADRPGLVGESAAGGSPA